jgi:hypothetical protein
MPSRSKESGAPESVALTRAERPVTVAVEVLAMVIPHPPSVPGVTWLWSGGVDAGT